MKLLNKSTTNPNYMQLTGKQYAKKGHIIFLFGIFVDINSKIL